MSSMTTRRHFIVAVLAGVLSHSLAFAAPRPEPSAALASLAERYYDEQAKMDPIFSATLIGSISTPTDLSSFGNFTRYSALSA